MFQRILMIGLIVAIGVIANNWWSHYQAVNACYDLGANWDKQARECIGDEADECTSKYRTWSAIEQRCVVSS